MDKNQLIIKREIYVNCQLVCKTEDLKFFVATLTNYLCRYNNVCVENDLEGKTLTYIYRMS